MKKILLTAAACGALSATTLSASESNTFGFVLCGYDHPSGHFIGVSNHGHVLALIIGVDCGVAQAGLGSFGRAGDIVFSTASPQTSNGRITGFVAATASLALVDRAGVAVSADPLFLAAMLADVNREMSMRIEGDELTFLPPAATSIVANDATVALQTIKLTGRTHGRFEIDGVSFVAGLRASGKTYVVNRLAALNGADLIEIGTEQLVSAMSDGVDLSSLVASSFAGPHQVAAA